MTPEESSKSKLPSLADYIVRFDLREILAEARLDYSETSSGAPRLLGQKDIAARFKKRPSQPEKPAE